MIEDDFIHEPWINPLINRARFLVFSICEFECTERDMGAISEVRLLAFSSLHMYQVVKHR
jgi:hypothetical protein